jgi:hypothetical protein
VDLKEHRPNDPATSPLAAPDVYVLEQSCWASRPSAQVRVTVDRIAQRQPLHEDLVDLAPCPTVQVPEVPDNSGSQILQGLNKEGVQASVNFKVP